MKQFIALFALLYVISISNIKADMNEAELAELAAQVTLLTAEDAAALVYAAVVANPTQKESILEAVILAMPEYSNVFITAAERAVLAATTAGEAVSDAYTDPVSHGAIGPVQTPSVSPN